MLEIGFICVISLWLTCDPSSNTWKKTSTWQIKHKQFLVALDTLVLSTFGSRVINLGIQLFPFQKHWWNILQIVLVNNYLVNHAWDLLKLFLDRLYYMAMHPLVKSHPIHSISRNTLENDWKWPPELRSRVRKLLVSLCLAKGLKCLIYWFLTTWTNVGNNQKNLQKFEYMFLK